MAGPASDIFFAPFRLEPGTGRLWNGATEIPVRPKTFAVLRHLVAQAGALVTVADLVHAVWADSAGSAPLVKGCMRELRKLLGDSAGTPRFIATVGRRGYRFIAPVEAAPARAAWLDEDERTPFVGRTAELAYLDAQLEAARAGTRRIVLLTGEAGIGKTTLATRFLAGAVARHPLRVAHGECVEHYGPGEPYLPVLHALATFGRGPGGDRLLDVLERYAPTWLAQLPPFLAADVRARLRTRAAGTGRAGMLREMCDAVVALAADRALVLWLDDLHWSDPSTIDLLTALARRTEPARLLLLASYRPAEVVVSRSPLGPARQSLLASGHARELGLAVLPGVDVERYLARRFPTHALPPALANHVLAITDGNPLFLRALLDELVATGVIDERDGTWRLRRRVEAIVEIVPESLRHLIERQVERLDDDDQRLLEAGSVAGREFAAGAVAAALDRDPDAVDERLHALARAGQCIEARGLDTPPHRPTSGRYAFTHALHQRVLASRPSPARRARLHRRLGAALEGAWGDRHEDLADELAVHFERGGDAPRAIRYLRLAAEKAARRLAVPEAIAHLERGLALVERLVRRDRPLAELQLQMALGLMLLNSTDAAPAHAERAHRRAADLAARVANRPELYPTLRGLHRVALLRGDLARALRLARKGLAMARKSRDPGALLEAHVTLGVSLFYAGERQPARRALARAVTLRAAVRSTDPALRMLDPVIVAHAHLGLLAQLSDASAEADAQREAMQREATRSSEPLALAYAAMGEAMRWQLAGNAEAVRVAVAPLLGIDVQAFALVAAFARCLHGWAVAVADGDAAGLDEIRIGLARWQAARTQFLAPFRLGLLAAAESALGRPGAARAALAEAVRIRKTTGERWWDPAPLRRRLDERSGRGRPRARSRRG